MSLASSITQLAIQIIDTEISKTPDFPQFKSFDAKIKIEAEVTTIARTGLTFDELYKIYQGYIESLEPEHQLRFVTIFSNLEKLNVFLNQLKACSEFEQADLHLLYKHINTLVKSTERLREVTCIQQQIDEASKSPHQASRVDQLRQQIHEVIKTREQAIQAFVLFFKVNDQLNDINIDKIDSLVGDIKSVDDLIKAFIELRHHFKDENGNIKDKIEDIFKVLEVAGWYKKEEEVYFKYIFSNLIRLFEPLNYNRSYNKEIVYLCLEYLKSKNISEFELLYLRLLIANNECNQYSLDRLRLFSSTQKKTEVFVNIIKELEKYHDDHFIFNLLGKISLYKIDAQGFLNILSLIGRFTQLDQSDIEFILENFDKVKADPEGTAFIFLNFKFKTYSPGSNEERRWESFAKLNTHLTLIAKSLQPDSEKDTAKALSDLMDFCRVKKIEIINQDNDSIKNLLKYLGESLKSGYKVISYIVNIISRFSTLIGGGLVAQEESIKIILEQIKLENQLSDLTITFIEILIKANQFNQENLDKLLCLANKYKSTDDLKEFISKISNIYGETSAVNILLKFSDENILSSDLDYEYLLGKIKSSYGNKYSAIFAHNFINDIDKLILNEKLDRDNIESLFRLYSCNIVLDDKFDFILRLNNKNYILDCIEILAKSKINSAPNFQYVLDFANDISKAVVFALKNLDKAGVLNQINFEKLLSLYKHCSSFRLCLDKYQDLIHTDNFDQINLDTMALLFSSYPNPIALGNKAGQEEAKQEEGVLEENYKKLCTVMRDKKLKYHHLQVIKCLKEEKVLSVLAEGREDVVTANTIIENIGKIDETLAAIVVILQNNKLLTNEYFSLLLNVKHISLEDIFSIFNEIVNLINGESLKPEWTTLQRFSFNRIAISGVFYDKNLLEIAMNAIKAPGSAIFKMIMLLIKIGKFTKANLLHLTTVNDEVLQGALPLLTRLADANLLKSENYKRLIELSKLKGDKIKSIQNFCKASSAKITQYQFDCFVKLACADKATLDNCKAIYKIDIDLYSKAQGYLLHHFFENGDMRSDNLQFLVNNLTNITEALAQLMCLLPGNVDFKVFYEQCKELDDASLQNVRNLVAPLVTKGIFVELDYKKAVIEKCKDIDFITAVQALDKNDCLNVDAYSKLSNDKALIATVLKLNNLGALNNANFSKLFTQDGGVDDALKGIIDKLDEINCLTKKNLDYLLTFKATISAVSANTVVSEITSFIQKADFNDDEKEDKFNIFFKELLPFAVLAALKNEILVANDKLRHWKTRSLIGGKDLFFESITDHAHITHTMVEIIGEIDAVKDKPKKSEEGQWSSAFFKTANLFKEAKESNNSFFAYIKGRQQEAKTFYEEKHALFSQVVSPVKPK